jgi:hypothetical protein
MHECARIVGCLDGSTRQHQRQQAARQGGQATQETASEKGSER